MNPSVGSLDPVDPAEHRLIAQLKAQAVDESRAFDTDGFMATLMQRLEQEAAGAAARTAAGWERTLLQESPQGPEWMAAPVWTVLPVLLLVGLGVWVAAQLLGLPTLGMAPEQWVDGLAGAAVAAWTAWMTWVAREWLGVESAEPLPRQSRHAAL